MARDMRRGRWVVRKPYKRGGVWYVPIRDIKDGRLHRLSTGRTRKAWVEDFIDEWLDEQEALASTQKPFEDAFREWLETKTLRPITRRGYLKDLEGPYTELYGGMLVGDVTFADAQRLIVKYRDLSARTRGRHVTTLRSFFRWAVDMEYARKNPFERVRVKRARPRRDHVLSEDEARALLAACREEYEVSKEEGDRGRPNSRWKETRKPARDLYVGVALGLYTGLRWSNLVGLDRSQVDVKRERIDIPGEKMKAGDAHSLPLHPALVPLLRRRALPLVLNAHALERAARRAGIPHVTWRSLRRTFASWLQARCSYACLKSLMAHALDEDVTGKYLVVSWPEKVRAIRSLPGLLGSAEVVSIGRGKAVGERS